MSLQAPVLHVDRRIRVYVLVQGLIKLCTNTRKMSWSAAFTRDIATLV